MTSHLVNDAKNYCQFSFLSINSKFNNIRWIFARCSAPSITISCARCYWNSIVEMSSIIYLFIIVIQIAFNLWENRFSMRIDSIDIVVNNKDPEKGFIDYLILLFKTRLSPLNFTDSCNLNEKINCIELSSLLFKHLTLNLN